MIKIEVTGNSIGEVADKLLAIGASLRSSASYAGVPNIAVDGAVAAMKDEAVEAQAAAPKRTRRKATDPVATAEAVVEPEAAPVGEPATAATEEASTTDASAAAQSDKPDTSASSPAAEPLDFTKHVMPAVLAAVERIGHEKVADIIGQFGVARASQVPEAQWQELIDLVTE